MSEYEQLKFQLLTTTLILGAVIFVCVWFTYSLNIALNYLLGACVSVVYLRMLSRDVDRLGVQSSSLKSLGSSRLALFVGLMVAATQWQQLQILPIFLGFLTYKGALLVYLLVSLIQNSRRA
ncbi:ATP synthase subunit I [Leptolyngbya sp. FACHB-261]|nr:ATP synthase subunit I [Leptolyngbya sp. FACHB-261]